MNTRSTIPARAKESPLEAELPALSAAPTGLTDDISGLPWPLSPTRAPTGWSLSLSRSRARRALESEGSQQSSSPLASPLDLSLELDISAEVELEDGEVPPSPPSASRAGCLQASSPSAGRADDLDELRLKSAALEGQTEFLRKKNSELSARLESSEKQRTALESEVKALKKKNSSLKHKLGTAVEKVSSLNRVVEGMNSKIQKQTAKIEHQRTNLSSLEKLHLTSRDPTANAGASNRPPSPGGATPALPAGEAPTEVAARSQPGKVRDSSRSVAKCKPCCKEASRAQDLQELTERMRLRLKHQATQLTQLGAALERAKQQAAPGRSWANAATQRQAEGSAATQLLQVRSEPTLQKNNCILQQEAELYPFEQDVLDVISTTFPMAKCIMQNFEETSVSLSLLRPSFRAAIAAMPPATRMLCHGRVKNLLPRPKDLLSPIEAVGIGLEDRSLGVKSEELPWSGAVTDAATVKVPFMVPVPPRTRDISATVSASATIALGSALSNASALSKTPTVTEALSLQTDLVSDLSEEAVSSAAVAAASGAGAFGAAHGPVRAAQGRSKRTDHDATVPALPQETAGPLRGAQEAAVETLDAVADNAVPLGSHRLPSDQSPSTDYQRCGPELVMTSGHTPSPDPGASPADAGPSGHAPGPALGPVSGPAHGPLLGAPPRLAAGPSFGWSPLSGSGPSGGAAPLAYPQYLYAGVKHSALDWGQPGGGVAWAPSLPPPMPCPPPETEPHRRHILPQTIARPNDVGHSASRKRSASNEARTDGQGSQTHTRERTERMTAEIKEMKRRILEHLQPRSRK